MSLKHLAMACAAASLLLLASTSHANVFAAHLTATNTGGNNYNISYRLNEDATAGVSVKVKGPLPATTVVRTINAGNQTKGANSVNWDGKNDASVDVAAGAYSFEVTASATGYGGTDLTKISDDANTFVNFFTPYGVEIDNNVASPNFGRIYVTNNAGATAGQTATTALGRVVSDGVYILSNDQTDITAQGGAGYQGAVAWVGTSSPWRMKLDGDGKIFICDWSDSHSGIWIMDPSNPSAAFDELFSTAVARDAGGLRAGLHGSIGGLWVSGSGASRVLYTLDEDLDLTAAAAGEGRGSIYQYNIGATSTNWSTAPTVVYDDFVAGNLQQNFNSCIAPGNNGWWISQYRSAETALVPSLIHVTLASVPPQTVDFNSANDLTGELAASNQAGMAVSEDGTKLAYAGNAFLKVFNIATFPTVTKLYEATSGNGLYSGSTSRDAAFDAAGNIYAANSSSELLRIYSPPGANSFTTPSPTGVSMTIASGVAQWLEY